MIPMIYNAYTIGDDLEQSIANAIPHFRRKMNLEPAYIVIPGDYEYDKDAIAGLPVARKPPIQPGIFMIAGEDE